MKDFMPKKNQQKKLIENVLALSAKARKEKEMNPSIINATVGSYYDESGQIKVFRCVKEAFEKPDYNNYLSYSSVKGSNEFIEAIKDSVLCSDYQDKYTNYYLNAIATCGGTGAIALAFATYLEKNEGVMLPNIMWPAYLQIATNLEINHHVYNLYNENGRLDLANIKEVANKLQVKYDKLFLVINDPCHNPTGFVMNDEDYLGLIALCNALSQKTKIILLLDIAYLDYGNDIGAKTRENFQLLKKLSSNVMVLFAFSASKTFGIYGLRLGALIQMTTIEKEVSLFNEATSYFARSIWSNTSHLGMEIVTKTLSDKKQRLVFEEEIRATSQNLEQRSKRFIEELEKYTVPFAPYQNGFFVLILVDNPIFEQKIESQGAYGCHFGNGYRIALSSISLEEAPRLGRIIGQAYQSIFNKK